MSERARFLVLVILLSAGALVASRALGEKRCRTIDGVEHCWHVHEWSDWEDTGSPCCLLRVPGCLGAGTTRIRRCSECGQTDSKCR